MSIREHKAEMWIILPGLKPEAVTAVPTSHPMIWLVNGQSYVLDYDLFLTRLKALQVARRLLLGDIDTEILREQKVK